MKKDSKLLPYLPYPRFLLDVDLTQTAKVLYAVLLDRANLSRANGWMDEDGNIYIVFPLNKIADLVDKGPSTVKNALKKTYPRKSVFWAICNFFKRRWTTFWEMPPHTPQRENA